MPLSRPTTNFEIGFDHSSFQKKCKTLYGSFRQKRPVSGLAAMPPLRPTVNRTRPLFFSAKVSSIVGFFPPKETSGLAAVLSRDQQKISSDYSSFRKKILAFMCFFAQKKIVIGCAAMPLSRPTVNRIRPLFFSAKLSYILRFFPPKETSGPAENITRPLFFCKKILAVWVFFQKTPKRLVIGYGVVTVSRIDQIIGLFCRISSVS